MSEFTISFTPNPSHQDTDYLTAQIHISSNELNIKQDPVQFGFFIRDDKDVILAGCNGWVIYKAIYIDQLWVNKTLRKRGLGTKLIENVHSYAKSIGCTMSTVSTMNFQAPDFYQKLGYEVDFIREGYTQRSSQYFLKKIL